MRTTRLNPLRHLLLGLGALAFALTCLSSLTAHAQSTDPFPATYADPAVPLLQLPTNFRARRTTADQVMLLGCALHNYRLDQRTLAV